MTTPVIAHYIGSYLSPTEGWIYDQLCHARGIESIVLTKETKQTAQFPWPLIYSTGGSVSQELGRLMHGFYPMHAAAALRHRVRIVHAHFGNRAAFACDLAEHLGVPLVASFYGRDLAAAHGYDRLFRTVERVLAEGPAAKERLIAIGCPPEKIRIHRLGVDPGKIEFQPRRRHRDEPLRVLMAGRFVEKKGFVHGIRAFCRASHLAPMELTIIGDAGRAPAERRIKRELLSEARKEGDKITFHPLMTRADFMDAVRAHHVLLQPSVIAADGDREGGHPVVLTLLAAGGMPAIATRHCDAPEVVDHGRSGWLCDEKDEDGLANALLHAYHADLEPMSRAARQLIESKYDIRQHTLDRAYEGVL